MTRRAIATAILAALSIGLVVGFVTGKAPSEAVPLPSSAFLAVPLPRGQTAGDDSAFVRIAPLRPAPSIEPSPAVASAAPSVTGGSGTEGAYTGSTPATRAGTRSAPGSYGAATERARTWARGLLGEKQWRCLDALVWRESRWSVFAGGDVHGVYGLPQANPGTKMASAGKDWRTNPRTQLRWMLGYVRARYGTACAAYGHAVSVGWY
jgi:hypothetical protein